MSETLLIKLEASELLHREAAAIDEQRWDDWIALYLPEAEFWVPTWATEETLTTNPKRELSHLYYATRAGLEDRVWRIRGGRSPASVPMPRTTHIVDNVLVEQYSPRERMQVKSHFVAHTFSNRSKGQTVRFGRYIHDFEWREAWLIRKKTVIINNDYVETMLDIYNI